MFPVFQADEMDATWANHSPKNLLENVNISHSSYSF